jgi:small subunit ribosomal protein S16
MLVIRFLRVSKKNQPSFKIVVVDKRRSSKSGRFLEEVGFYNPLTKEKVLKAERIKYWLSKGVQPSPTVHNLLIKEKIIEGKKIPVHKKPKKKEEKKTEEAKPVPETKPEAKPEAKPSAPVKTMADKEAAPEGGEPRPEFSGREKPAEKTEPKKE